MTAPERVTLIEIKGDRQYGKTHLLLDLVAGEIRRGRKVRYETVNWPIACEALRRLVHEHLSPDIDQLRVTDTNSAAVVEHRSGGKVTFRSMKARSAAPTHKWDTYVFDDVEFPLELLWGPPTRIYYAPRSHERVTW
ncbi:hypothetical protein [Mycobacteroides abscessus]|uniref:hypothetical protein n=1 Tax=Mycobacteroides abscessus TaxID=36809 RepID=UPI0009A5A572|nr:hypothetical protein [Mycobacteroides abscessus]